jgi:signal transduction histidine kinase
MKAKARGHWVTRENFTLTAILFVAVAGLSMLPFAREFQARLTDTFFRFAPIPKPRSKVVLVVIDEESLRRFGRWPWPRALLARLTDKLARSGAAVIGLDILLSEAQSSQDDQALADSLRDSAPTVIVDKIASFADGPRWIEPLSTFAGAAHAVGHAHAVLDTDSICRRFPPRELALDGDRWAFAVELARVVDPRQTEQFISYHGVRPADTAEGISVVRPLLIRIPFRRGAFETLSAQAVLDNPGALDLRARPVLVGFGSTEIGDRIATPLSGELPTPGVEVHAQILDGILSNRTLQDAPLWATTVLLFLTSAFLIGVLRRWRGWAGMGFLVCLAAVLYFGSFAFFLLAGWMLPAGYMMLAVFFGPLLTYTADFITVERSLTKQLLGLRSWLAPFPVTSASEHGEVSWKLQLLQSLQTELGSLYELHKTLLEFTRDLVAVFDRDSKLLLQNKAFARAFPPGASPQSLDELRRRLIPNTRASDDPSAATDENEAYLGAELYSIREVPLPPTFIAPRGGTMLTLASLRAREERDRARAEALGFITHELRTPLVSIQGFAEFMMQYPESSLRSTAPETIFREAKRLLALINSYLDVLRIDAGAKSLSVSNLDVAEIVRQVFGILQPLASASEMRLVYRSARETSSIVGDEPLIGGALLNLVSNAIKYGTTGTSIEVECSQSGGATTIVVRNQGPSVSAEQIPHLFDAYYRTSAAQLKPGWGLGLAFVKRIVEKHGGSVSVRNLPGGTEFEIQLPTHALTAVSTGE